MRVVLDSNVLISALISTGSPPHLIYRAWRDKHFTLVTSKAQLAELRRASRYPKLRKLVPPREFGALINRLHGALVLDKLSRIDILADSADNYLLGDSRRVRPNGVDPRAQLCRKASLWADEKVTLIII